MSGTCLKHPITVNFITVIIFDGPQNRCGRSGEEGVFIPYGNRTLAVHSVARRYNN